MQLVCHDTGDSRVPWRRPDLKGADFFPLIFCPCKQNHKIILCLVKVWQPLRTALFEAAVIISLSAEYSQPRWLWWPVHCGTSGQHAQRWIWGLPWCLGSRHSLLKEPASCIRSLDRELIGFLKQVLGIDWSMALIKHCLLFSFYDTSKYQAKSVVFLTSPHYSHSDGPTFKT